MRAWAAFGLALLFLSSQWAAPLHYLLVAHSVCADHGELVHEPHSSGVERAPPEPLGTTLSSAQPADEHHHCGASVATPPLDRPSAGPGLAPLERAAPTPCASLTAEALRARDIYGFAPKTSPPRLG